MNYKHTYNLVFCVQFILVRFCLYILSFIQFHQFHGCNSLHANTVSYRLYRYVHDLQPCQISHAKLHCFISYHNQTQSQMQILNNCHTVQNCTEGPLLTNTTYFPKIKCHTNRSWNSSWQESSCNSRQEQEIYLFSKASRLALELTQPLIQWVQRPLSPGVKQPRHEANHTSPS